MMKKIFSSLIFIILLIFIFSKSKEDSILFEDKGELYKVFVSDYGKSVSVFSCYDSYIFKSNFSPAFIKCSHIKKNIINQNRLEDLKLIFQSHQASF